MKWLLLIGFCYISQSVIFGQTEFANRLSQAAFELTQVHVTYDPGYYRQRSGLNNRIFCF